MLSVLQSASVKPDHVSKTPSASGLAGFEWPPSLCDLPARVGSAGRDPGLFGLICCFLKTNATFHPLLEIFTNTTPEALKKNINIPLTEDFGRT